jgi:uracil phosphoribosyltransferase
MLALYFGSIISDILFMFLNEEQTSKSQQKTVMHITTIAAGILLIEGILQKCACIKYGMLGINPNKLTSKYAVAGYAPKITSLAINKHITFCMDNKLKYSYDNVH